MFMFNTFQSLHRLRDSVGAQPGTVGHRPAALLARHAVEDVGVGADAAMRTFVQCRERLHVGVAEFEVVSAKLSLIRCSVTDLGKATWPR
jgi:hypothetical protein